MVNDDTSFLWETLAKFDPLQNQHPFAVRLICLSVCLFVTL